jgi:RHS repeat-associated protein
MRFMFRIAYGGGFSDAYNYDAMGNRSTASLAINGGATTTYTANNANQYNSISGMSAPIHDPNGNLTYQNGVTYTWDSENRLLSVSDGTTTNAYTYDGLHRRVTKRTTVSGIVTEKTHFLYDDWNVIEERTNSDTATTFTLSTFTLTRTLTWGTDLSGKLQGAGGVGGLLMVEEISGSTTTACHFHYDGNGNVTEITDASGNPAATYRYDAFGNTLVATGSYATTNNYRFSTKPIDAEITTAPLYYYGYRYYDPVTGRWPSRDPIEESGGLNMYGFCSNNPNLFDILGLSSCTDFSDLNKAKILEQESEVQESSGEFDIDPADQQSIFSKENIRDGLSKAMKISAKRLGKLAGKRAAYAEFSLSLNYVYKSKRGSSANAAYARITIKKLLSGAKQKLYIESLITMVQITPVILMQKNLQVVG